MGFDSHMDQHMLLQQGAVGSCGPVWLCLCGTCSKPGVFVVDSPAVGGNLMHSVHASRDVWRSIAAHASCH